MKRSLTIQELRSTRGIIADVKAARHKPKKEARHKRMFCHPYRANKVPNGHYMTHLGPYWLE